MRARNHQTDVLRKKLTWWMVEFFFIRNAQAEIKPCHFSGTSMCAAASEDCCVKSQQEIWVRYTVFLQSPTSSLVLAQIRLRSKWACSLCCLVTTTLHCCMHSSRKREFSPRTVTLCEVVHGTAATGVTFFFFFCQAEILWSQLVGVFLKGVLCLWNIASWLFCSASSHWPMTPQPFSEQFRLKSCFYRKSFDFIAI